MKKSFLGLLACLGMMIALPCCKPSPAEWKLVWEDNFDQADSFAVSYTHLTLPTNSLV